MSPLDYSRDRLRTFLGEIRRLKDSDFPHQHPRQVLERIEDIIQTRWDALAKLTPANDPAVVHVACSESLSQLFTYLPLLGFVLRSTNVRNSFEIYGPLLRMARSILGAGSKLVLSSEWSFSPFVYRPITDLPNVVLIGLPASEADNPLLTPLAGHELGHSIWQQKQIGTKYDAILQNEILAATKARWSDFCQIYGFPGSTPFSADLFVLRKAAYAQAWAMKQVEESFCDVLGVRIFGESYLYAFAYLLSPGAAGFRSAAYPNMARRTANLAKAAADFGVSVPAGYGQWFADEPLPGTASKEDTFLLSLADGAADSLIVSLISEARSIAANAAIPDHSQQKVNEVYAAFRLIVPSTTAESLANILNAGWKAYHDPDLWKDVESVIAARSIVLKELVLKSIEVLEIEQLMAAP